MIGINGSLFVLLCLAYFVLVLCACSLSGGAARGDRSMPAPVVDELARRRALRAARASAAVPVSPRPGRRHSPASHGA